MLDYKKKKMTERENATVQNKNRNVKALIKWNTQVFSWNIKSEVKFFQLVYVDALFRP